jgi:hypothetical protein
MIGLPPIAYTSEMALAAAMHAAVGGRDQRLIGVELVYRRVVAGGDADEQLLRQRQARRILEDFRKQPRRDLAAAASAMGKRSELDLGSVHNVHAASLRE